MTHQTFKERLEEIPRAVFFDELSIEVAIESLITLFEEYTKAIVGEEETYDDLVLEDNAMHKAIWSGRYVRNEHRQTINQTSKTILRGENDEYDKSW